MIYPVTVGDTANIYDAVDIVTAVFETGKWIDSKTGLGVTRICQLKNAACRSLCPGKYHATTYYLQEARRANGEKTDGFHPRVRSDYPNLPLPPNKFRNTEKQPFYPVTVDDSKKIYDAVEIVTAVFTEGEWEDDDTDLYVTRIRQLKNALSPKQGNPEQYHATAYYLQEAMRANGEKTKGCHPKYRGDFPNFRVPPNTFKLKRAARAKGHAAD